MGNAKVREGSGWGGASGVIARFHFHESQYMGALMLLSIWYCVCIVLPQDGRTALISASANGSLDVLKALLAAGSDKEARDEVCSMCVVARLG